MLNTVKEWFRPARQGVKTPANSNLIADLDAMLVEPVHFRFQGKDHVIKPLTVEQFMRVTADLERIYDLKAIKDKVTPQQLIDIYYDLVHDLCPTVSKKDIEMASQVQIAAMFEMIVQTITGKIFVDTDKKKLPRIQNP